MKLKTNLVLLIAFIIVVVVILIFAIFYKKNNTSTSPIIISSTIGRITPVPVFGEGTDKPYLQKKYEECNGPLMDRDEAVAKYLPIWKKIYMSLNDMSDEYFNAHISVDLSRTDTIYSRDRNTNGVFDSKADPCSIMMRKAEFLWVSYKVKVDWAEWTETNMLMIRDLEEGGGYWDEDKILSVGDDPNNGSTISRFNPVEKLQYGRSEAIEKIKTIKPELTAEPGRFTISFDRYRGHGPEMRGHIFFVGDFYGDDCDDNCFSIYLNLTGGKDILTPIPCCIDYGANGG